MKRLAISVVIVCVVIAAGFAVAQSNVPAEPREPAAHFSVTVCDGLPMLVDQTTGQTWLLQKSTERIENAAWIPIPRLDTAEAVTRWRIKDKSEDKQAELARMRAKLQEYRQILHDQDSPVVRRLEKQIEELEASLKK